jgi:hypothetical protein
LNFKKKVEIIASASTRCRQPANVVFVAREPLFPKTFTSARNATLTQRRHLSATVGSWKSSRISMRLRSASELTGLLTRCGKLTWTTSTPSPSEQAPPGPVSHALPLKGVQKIGTHSLRLPLKRKTEGVEGCFHNHNQYLILILVV